jgi:hypothetical protein
MRRVPAVLVLVLIAAACANEGSGGPGSGEPSGQAGPDPTRVEIYTAAFRSLAETERWFDPVLLDERICPDVAEVGKAEQAPGRERFTEAEQAAILTGLVDFPGVRFVDDAERIQDRILEDELEVGPGRGRPAHGGGDRG